MKIIFLNCWYLKIEQKLLQYVDYLRSEDTIFCFTEVDEPSLLKISQKLINHKFISNTDEILTDVNHFYAQAIFYPNKFKLLDKQKIFTFRNIRHDVGFDQVILLEIENKKMWVSNIHGKARPGHKLDTPARLRQSKTIIDFLKDRNELKIIGGDFNLMPQTKSIRLFEENGYIDLIQKFNIKDTRGKINAEKYRGRELQHFADYCFVSKDIKVKSFEVPDTEISDHLPLILEFDVS